MSTNTGDYQEYNNLGIRFPYPTNWSVQTESWDEGTYVITVDSPEGSFWSVTIYPKGIDREESAQKILHTLKGEYDKLEHLPVHRYIADRRLTGYEVNFFYLDMTSTAMVLHFEEGDRAYVLFWQTCDRLALMGEKVSHADVFEAMTHAMMTNLQNPENKGIL